MAEMRGFVFAIIFIVLFSVILSTVPIDLQGAGETPDTVQPINPSLLSDFSSTKTYVKDNFTLVGSLRYYFYDLGGYSWKITLDPTGSFFDLGAKVLVGGVLWLGQLDSVKFVSSGGNDRGGYLAFTEIDEDATDGQASYDLFSIGGGNSMGGFIVYWNTTTYSDSSSAWAASKLYLLHGMGISDSATANIGSLLVRLLLLQLPDVPLLLNILLATPVWACILYVLWFIIKEMIPFV
jgi:predicted secreted protein